MEKLQGYLSSSFPMHAIVRAIALFVQTVLCHSVMFEDYCDCLCFSVLARELLGLLQIGTWKGSNINLLWMTEIQESWKETGN